MLKQFDALDYKPDNTMISKTVKQGEQFQYFTTKEDTDTKDYFVLEATEKEIEDCNDCPLCDYVCSGLNCKIKMIEHVQLL